MGSAKSCEKEIHIRFEGIRKELDSLEATLIKDVNKVKDFKLELVGQCLDGVKSCMKKLSQVTREKNKETFFFFAALPSFVLPLPLPTTYKGEKRL